MQIMVACTNLDQAHIVTKGEVLGVICYVCFKIIQFNHGTAYYLAVEII